MSWLGPDVLELQHDVFSLVYLTFAPEYLAHFAARTGPAWQEMLRRHASWRLAVGILVGVGVVLRIMGRQGTPHPGGAFFASELVWRGLVYGAINAVVLAVFPAVSGAVLRGDRKGFGRKAGVRLAGSGVLVVHLGGLPPPLQHLLRRRAG